MSDVQFLAKVLAQDADLCANGHRSGDTEGGVQVGEEVPLEEGQGGEEPQ